MHVAALTLELHLPGCSSLKEKRSHLKPILARVHKRFNVSAAEIGLNDSHTTALLACVVVSNDHKHAQRLLAGIPLWLERRFPHITLIEEHIEVF